MLPDIPAHIPVASWEPAALWRAPLLLHRFWLCDLFSSGASQLKKTKETSELGGRKENHPVLFCRARISSCGSGDQNQICCWPRVMWAQEWEGDRGTAVTPSTAFTLCKCSGDDTCVKNSLKVKVQYSGFELVNKALL